MAGLWASLLFGRFAGPGLAVAFEGAIFLLAFRESKVFPPSSLGAWFAWLVWMALSAAHSAQPLSSLGPVSQWGAAVALWGLLRTRGNADWRGTWIVGVFALGIAAGAAIAVMGPPGLLPPNQNYTAMLMAAAAAAGLGLWGRSAVARRVRLAAVAAMILAVIGLLWLKSRGALLGLLAAAAAGLVPPWSRRRTIWLLSGAAFAAALALWIWPDGILTELKLGDPQALARPHLWLSALKVIADHPWLGEGPGNFELGLWRHLPLSGRTLIHYGFYAAQAHSEVLELAAESGIVGLGLFLVAFWKTVQFAGERGIFEESAFRAVVAMSAQACVDNVLHLPGAALFFFSALAASRPDEAAPASRLPAKEGRKGARERLSRLSWKALGVAGLLGVAGAVMIRAKNHRSGFP